MFRRSVVWIGSLTVRGGPCPRNYLIYGAAHRFLFGRALCLLLLVCVCVCTLSRRCLVSCVACRPSHLCVCRVESTVGEPRSYGLHMCTSVVLRAGDRAAPRPPRLHRTTHQAAEDLVDERRGARGV